MTTQKDLINALLDKQGNTFTTAQETAAGISRNSLSYWTRKEEIERVKPGVYTGGATFEDPFFAIQSRILLAILSRPTAAYLLGFTTEPSTNFKITLPRNHHMWPWRGIYEINVRSKRSDKLRQNTMQIKTSAGNYVTTYTPEQTIVDL